MWLQGTLFLVYHRHSRSWKRNVRETKEEQSEYEDLVCPIPTVELLINVRC